MNDRRLSLRAGCVDHGMQYMSLMQAHPALSPPQRIVAQTPGRPVVDTRFGLADRIRRCLRLGSSPGLALICVLIVVRLLLAGGLVLLPEEAYYWMYSKYPAWGYFDHPPVVAWLISMGTAVFGHTEFGVRVGTCILGATSTWLCYVLAADWYGCSAGLPAAVLFAITPMFFGTGFAATPDAPLVCFWLLALVGVTKAYRGDAPAWWLVAGAAVGLGFMSKYPAAFLVPSTCLFLLSDVRGRRMLRSPFPWLALLLAGALASPVVYWNATNGWASFRFQFMRRFGEQAGFAPLATPSWLGAQFVLLTPLVFLLLALTLWIAIRRFRQDTAGHYRFAACFALPWLLVCLWHGLSNNVKINWPLPAYLSLIPSAAILLRIPGLPGMRWNGWAARRRLVRRYVAGVAAVLIMISTAAVVRPAFIPLPEPISPWNRIGADTESAEEAVESATGRHPFIITDDKYRLASELGFYMRERPGDDEDDWRDVVPVAVAAGDGLAFHYWRQLTAFVGRDAIYVTNELSPAVSATLAQWFESVGPPRPLFSNPHVLGRQRIYWAIPCRTFRKARTTVSG